MRTIKGYCFDYLDNLKNALNSISYDDLERIINQFLKAYNKKKQIFVMGNGGSGATASHFACDLNKGTNLRFRAICLNDNVPSVLAYANDVSYKFIFALQLRNFIKKNDIVMGISASGDSENIVKAIRYANEEKALTIGLTGFDGGQLAKEAKISLIIPSNDMQIIEDAHLAITHIIMRAIKFHYSANKEYE